MTPTYFFSTMYSIKQRKHCTLVDIFHYLDFLLASFESTGVYTPAINKQRIQDGNNINKERE